LTGGAENGPVREAVHPRPIGQKNGHSGQDHHRRCGFAAAFFFLPNDGICARQAAFFRETGVHAGMRGFATLLHFPARSAVFMITGKRRTASGSAAHPAHPQSGRRISETAHGGLR
jgi:hypothetical protein